MNGGSVAVLRCGTGWVVVKIGFADAGELFVGGWDTALD